MPSNVIFMVPVVRLGTKRAFKRLNKQNEPWMAGIQTDLKLEFLETAEKLSSVYKSHVVYSVVIYL